MRSFKDSSGDGIGDLQGISDNLEHIRTVTSADSNGVGAVILSSIHKSQNVDYNYDVINFVEVDPIFGSIEDLKKLVEEAHKKDLKVILDFVPNHTSDQHEWFRRSTAGDPDFADFYVWHDGYPSKNGGRPSPPNNWVSGKIDFLIHEIRSDLIIGTGIGIFGKRMDMERRPRSILFA